MANTDKVEWILYAANLTTRLRILPVATGHLYLEMNSPGSGEVKIPLDSEAAGVITSGMFVQCNYRGAARGGFFVENIKKQEVDAGENAGRWLSTSGRGALALLDQPIVWDNGSSESTREFTDVSKASILITLLTEIQARGGLSTLTWDFTAAVDSSAVAWTDAEEYQVTVGDSILKVAQNFADTGGFEFKINLVGAGFVLSAYKNGIGTNKSSTVFFRAGTNCLEISSDTRGDDLINAYLVKYKDGFAVVKDDTSITGYGRREKIINVELAQTLESATTFAAAKLAETKDPKISYSLNLYDGVAPNLFLDYEMGDTITYDVKGTQVSYRILSIQADFENEDFANVVVELNSIFYDNDLKRASDVDWLLKQWNTARDANLMEVRQWVALGLPTDLISYINGMTMSGDYLYVVGGIGKIGGVTVSRVARYNFTSGVWEAVGADISAASIDVICIIGSDVYVGGNTSNIYKLNGTAWDVIGAGTLLSSVYCMATDGTNLYVGGNFDDIDGDTSLTGLAKWNGMIWSDIGGAYTSALFWDGANLIAGSTTGTVRSWDGAVWTTLGGSLGGRVNALTVLNGKITAGGEFTGFLSQFDGATWATIAGIDDKVRALATYLSDLYVAGDFSVGIKRYSGGYWYDLADGVNGDVNAVALYNTTVIAGGEFTQAGEVQAQKLAAYFTNFSDLVDRLSNSGVNYDLGEGIHGATAVTTPLDADEFPLWKASVGLLRKVTWANVKATLETYFNTLYFKLTNMLVGQDQVAVGNAAGQLIGDDLLRWKLRGLRIGENSPEFDFADVYPIAVVAKNADESISLVGYAYGDAGGGFPVHSYRSYRSRGTRTSPTALQINNYLSDWRALGHDGAGFFTGWQIRSKTTENWSGTTRGTMAEILLVRNGEADRHVVMSFWGDGSFAPEILTADPVSPAIDSMWLLRETTAGHADGEAMGVLGLTYTGDTGVDQPLKLSVNDNGTTLRLQFA